MATHTQAHDTSHYIPTDSTLARLVEAAKTSTHDCPDAAARIHRGAALVEAGAVRFDGTRCTVKSGDALYPVTDKCPCPDMAQRGKPCKHKWSKWLALRLAQENTMPPVRFLRFVASLGDGAAQRHGIATVLESGAVFFAEYDAGENLQLTDEKIVYKLVLGRRLGMAE